MFYFLPLIITQIKHIKWIIAYFFLLFYNYISYFLTPAALLHNI